MNFGETVVWYVTVWIPGVIVDAFFNYLVFWLPLAILLFGGLWLEKRWKARQSRKRE